MSQQSVYDAIVLGLGGMGAAACYEIARSGHRVLGLEQFHLLHARGSSHGEVRAIRRAYFEHADYIPLLNRSYELWQRLEAEAACNLLDRCGLVLFADRNSSIVYRESLRSADTYGVEVEEIDGADIAKKFHLYRAPENFSALFEPGAGFVALEKSIETFLNRAKSNGANIHSGEKVLGWNWNGKEFSVTTNAETYVSKKLVVCGGPWTATILEKLKLPLKLSRLIQYWFKADKKHAVQNGTPCFAYDLPNDFIYGFPMIDGATIKIASHNERTPLREPSEVAVDNPLPHQLKNMKDFVREFLPFVQPELVKFSPCIYTLTPDEHFIIDRATDNPNLCFAAGFSGHGFKFCPVVGELLCKLAFQEGIAHPVPAFLRLREFTQVVY